jgi:uncharacterized protein YndB with AHSA1/START domain
MKFTLALPIAKSRTEVWEAFDSPENMKVWQPALIKYENISGKPGQPGAVSKLMYAEGRREFFLMEKVIHRAEPDRFDVVYENDFADNTVNTTFIATSDTETLWKMEVKFKFKTILMKIVGPFAKKSFINRSEREMERFKEFVEKL